MTIQYFWFNGRASPPQLMLTHLTDIERLMIQLTKRPQAMDRTRIMASGGTGTRTVFAIDPDVGPDGRIMGTGSLAPVRTPSSYCGLIEDIVVEASYRKQGIGHHVMEMLIAEARQLKMHYLQLTNWPDADRIGARRLMLGFERREVNVYRLVLEQ
jgi:GNAT superfamily N-acetyltransferase